LGISAKQITHRAIQPLDILRGVSSSGHPTAGYFARCQFFIEGFALDGAGNGDARPLHLDSAIAIDEDDFGTAAVVEGEVKGFVVPFASPIFVEGFFESGVCLCKYILIIY